MQKHPNTQEPEPIEPLLLTTNQTAMLLNVSTRMVWKLKSTGALPVVRIGRSTRYDRRDILKFIDQNKNQLN